MMAQAGLLDKWRHQYQPKGPCLKASQKRTAELKSNNSKNKSTLSRLSLKNLSGAFVILVFGMTFSITFFIGERLIFRHHNRSIRRPAVFVNNRITPIAPKVLEIINLETADEGKKTDVIAAPIIVTIKENKQQTKILKETIKNKPKTNVLTIPKKIEVTKI